MSQILDDLKESFKKIDEFYSNKLRDPIVNFIKSSKEVLNKISSKFKSSECALYKDIGEPTFNEVDNASNEVYSVKSFEMSHAADTDDIPQHPDWM